MPAPWLDPALSILFTLGVAGPVLGVVSLFVRPGTRAYRTALLALGVGGGGACATAALAGLPLLAWLPLLCLLGACGAFWALREGYVHAALAWLTAPLRSHRFHAALLLVGSPSAAIYWALFTADADVLYASPDELDAEDLVERSFQPIEPSPAFTDAGRPFPVARRLNPPAQAPNFLARQSELLRRWRLSERIIVLPDLTPESNCHGWVFTGGKHTIFSRDVPRLLEENHYRQVADLQVGDLAVYWNDEGGVVHTGVVCAAGEKGPVLVQSKWGDLGCFIHTPDGHHYGPVVCRYYRSPRRGHILRGLAGGPTDKPPAPTAPRGTPPILAPQLVGE